MNFSIESRVPFLDYRLVEASLMLPSKDILNNGRTKYILRESMKGLLPDRIAERRDKKGFSNPRRDWFKSEEFQELIMDILASQSFRNLDIFNVEQSKKKYSDHISGKSDHSKDIWKWINIYEWKKQLIHGNE